MNKSYIYLITQIQIDHIVTFTDLTWLMDDAVSLVGNDDADYYTLLYDNENSDNAEISHDKYNDHHLQAESQCMTDSNK